MSDSAILRAIQEQEGLAAGFGSLQDERAEALNLYAGRPYGDEQEGRSQVVMRDVADTVEWIKPSLMKVFASGDEVCSFAPTGPEDQDQAEQETDYVNHVLMQKNNGFLILHDWFHDAMLQKTGYVLVGHEIENRRQREPYSGLTDDEFALIAGNPEVELVEHSVRVIGQSQDGQPITVHDCVCVQTVEYGCTRVRNIPPERVLVASDWPDLDLQGCPFVEIIEWPTISQLREQGYDIDDEVDDSSEYNADAEEEERRSVMGHVRSDREDIEADPATRRVRCRRVWIRFDHDGDGIAELRHVVVVGTTELENDETDLIPVAALTPQRTPHEHYGVSVADLIKDLQRIRTVLVRGFLDSMYLANNGRHAIDTQRVNLDDMLVSRPGGVVRVDGDPSSAIFPLQHMHQGPAILQAVEYIDSVRENRTGVTRYNQGLDANSLNKTAQGINQIMTASQQRVELIARVLAETGVKALMLIIHAVSLKHSRQAEMIKLRNQWVQVDPRSWKNRRDMVVSVGLGTGNKDQMLQHLHMILMQQQQGMAVGLATPATIHNTLKKISQNAGFRNPDEFWSDPAKNPAPQQPNPEMIKAKARMQELQFSAQQDQMKVQAEQQTEQIRLQHQAALDGNREEMQARQKQLEMQQQAELAQLQAQYQAEADERRIEFERWKASLDASVKLEIASKSAQTTMDTAQMAREPDTRVDELIATIKQLQDEANAPAEIVRDQSGVAIAVKRGERVRKINRGPDGRAIGVQ